MAFAKSPKKANALHPQIVILVIDNSGSMAEMDKCRQVTDAVQDMVITMQSLNLGSCNSRFFLSICRFGDSPEELALAATPPEVDIDKLVFAGDQGGTDMRLALEWAQKALGMSLARSRQISNYREELAPNPLIVFLSDGEDTGEDDPMVAVRVLHSCQLKDGGVDLIAVGVGMQDEHFEIMKRIASKPDYAIRIESEGIAEFLSDVASTVLQSTTVGQLAAKAR